MTLFFALALSFVLLQSLSFARPSNDARKIAVFCSVIEPN
jgi:di/tricarboxylate transporter